MAASTQTRGISAYLSRFMLAMKAGFQFDGYRDLYRVFGYDRILTSEKMRAKYARQDVAKTIVNKPAEALWTSPPKVRADATFTKEWETFVTKHDLWAQFLRVDKLLGVEPYAVLLLGLPGEPKQAYSGNGDKIMYIQPYGAANAAINEIYSDPENKQYGMPSKYNITSSFEAGSKRYSNALHTDSSRIIHLTNELLDSNLMSAPRLEAVYNLLEDLSKIAGGSAETYWLTANRGMQVDVDKDMDLSETDAAALTDELDEFQHQLRRYIRTRGVKVNTLGSEVADPTGPFRVLIGLLAGATGIPQRVLMGAEAGQLSSEQDRANWAELIDTRRKSFAVPHIIMPTIKRLVEIKALPEPKGDITFEWPEAFHLSPLERAQTMAQTARAVVNLSRQSQYGLPIITQKECRSVVNFNEEPDVSFPEVTDAIPPVKDPNKVPTKVDTKESTDEKAKEDASSGSGSSSGTTKDSSTTDSKAK